MREVGPVLAGIEDLGLCPGSEVSAFLCATAERRPKRLAASS